MCWLMKKMKKKPFDRFMERHQKYYEVAGEIRRERMHSPMVKALIEGLELHAERYYSLAQKIKKGDRR